jgi:hypothetical protein
VLVALVVGESDAAVQVLLIPFALLRSMLTLLVLVLALILSSIPSVFPPILPQSYFGLGVLVVWLYDC